MEKNSSYASYTYSKSSSETSATRAPSRPTQSKLREGVDLNM